MTSGFRGSAVYGRAVSFCTTLLFASLAVFGQTTSTINGTVTDRSGAVVSDARVIVTNMETQVAREATTTAEGFYSLPLLPPGRYQLNIQKEGFRPVVQENITLEVNQVARLDFSLELGSVTESVVVTAAAPLIESDTSALGQVIENRQIIDLPLNGRNFVQLAILGPGVTGVGYGASGTIMSGSRPDDLRPGSEIFSNGNREGSNNFMYDGIDNNERLTLSITLRPSVEAVREFKIQTNMFSADQGRNAGATVNVISKSGTNEFHGSLYEFVRNDIFDAREYFAPSDRNKPAFRQNQFGGSLGGPVIP
ncbi:MAG: carboxypeptidase regulatory-like domain-containing protein, partial [Bryobacteraceae bacterium]